MSRIAVNIITGFLGSGKTSLLNQLFKQTPLPHTLVLINEFGDVGIDHLLVEHIKENLIVLAGGCLCCQLRGDLFQSLEQLYRQRQQKQIPYFDKIIIETSGLADPAPILHTFIRDAFLAAHYRLDNLIVTADALYIETQLKQHAVTSKQLALAQHVVITKAKNKQQKQKIKQLIQRHNPSAEFHQPPLNPRDIFCPARKRLVNYVSAYQTTSHRDLHGIDSFCLHRKAPLRLAIVEYWLRQITSLRGHDVLRIKGLLHTLEYDKPLLIQGVRHSLQTPKPLKCWQTEPQTQLVFITQNLSKQTLIRSLDALSRCENIAQVCVAAEILLSA